MNNPIFSNQWLLSNLGYSGNSQADMMEKEMENSSRVSDRYLCSSCRFFVKEELFIKENNCCEECFMEFKQGGIHGT